jgi:hypothetical protein
MKYVTLNIYVKKLRNFIHYGTFKFNNPFYHNYGAVSHNYDITQNSCIHLHSIDTVVKSLKYRD